MSLAVELFLAGMSGKTLAPKPDATPGAATPGTPQSSDESPGSLGAVDEDRP